MPFLFALLIPIALIISWIYRGVLSLRRSTVEQLTHKVQHNYLIGLNYLLNEQPDRAVDALIKAIEVDATAIETHLALGILFRKKGEVERAIRIHQNLIARPQLSISQRLEALLELGRDFLSAGMLDRAEGLFIEIINMGNATESAFMHLLEIYELEKNWQMAIQTAHKLQASQKRTMNLAIGHYYCELAEEAMLANMLSSAHKHIKKALAIDSKSVRASLLLGKYQLQLQNYKAAIRAYKTIEQQDPHYLAEMAQPLLACYQHLQAKEQWLNYMQRCYQNHPQLNLAIEIANFLQEQQQYKEAYQLLMTHLSQYPSLLGIASLLNLQIAQDQGNEQTLVIIQQFLNNLLLKQPNYQCQKCGYSGRMLLWLCPGCHRWNTIKPIDDQYLST